MLSPRSKGEFKLSAACWFSHSIQDQSNFRGKMVTKLKVKPLTCLVPTHWKIGGKEQREKSWKRFPEAFKNCTELCPPQ